VVAEVAATAVAGVIVELPLRVMLLVAPDTEEPMLIVVVEPDTPAVPIFIVLVAADTVAPVPRFCVSVAVEPPIVKDVAATPIVIVVGVANKARVAAFELTAGEFKFIDVEDMRFAVAVFVAFPIAIAEAFVPPMVIVPKEPVVLVPTSMVIAPELPVEPAEPVAMDIAPD
jgi:hypothetical protein